MFKRWMRSEAHRQPDGGWLPVLQIWEERPGGAVERERLVPEPIVTAATRQEALEHGAELARRWLRMDLDRTPVAGGR